MSATPSLGIYYLELLSKAGDSREALSLGQTPNWLQCQAWWHSPLYYTEGRFWERVCPPLGPQNRKCSWAWL